MKVHQRLQLAYHWRYLFLVVNAQAGQLHWCWLNSMAGKQMAAAVGGLKKHTEVATLVWDGAPGHQDQGVRELGLPLIGLPPTVRNSIQRNGCFKRCGELLRGRYTPLWRIK